MIKEILSFAYCLRKAGIPVSVDQIATVFEALNLIEPEETTFKVILRASFAKTKQEIAVFEQVYSMYFGSLPHPFNNTVEKDLVDETALKMKVEGCDGKGVGRSGIGPSKGNLLVSLFDQAKLRALAKALVAELEWDTAKPQPVGAYWEKIKKKLDWHMLQYQVAEKLELKEAERVFLLEKLESLAGLVEYYIHQEIIAREERQGMDRILEELNYEKHDFGQLNEAGLQVIEQQVKKLGRKLASRKGYRYQTAGQGQIDIKKTIKGSVSRGGIPVHLKRKNRKVEHPELLVLCDISNSMSQYTQFLLLLVRTIQIKSKSIRSFVFVDRLAEVTHLLNGKGALEELRFIGIHAPCSATGFTDYGRVFADFVTNYLQSVHAKVKIMIFGDGKNNWRNPHVEAFKEMADKVNGIYWLNPQPQDLWYENDSVLALYKPYCRGIYKCSNLAELKQVTSSLV